MVLWCSQPKHARVICGTRWTSTVHSSLEDRLKVHFNKVMQNDNIPLFKDFEVYKSSLPVRREETTGDQVPLYKLPHWTVENDMKSLAYQLEKLTHLRARVKYLCAPGSSGKTSCILPAFLKSTENEKDGFTHYLYLAFSNNDNNFFQVSKSSKITNDAESQGASFIFECLKILLELPGKQGPHLVPVDKHAKLTEFLKRLWATLLLRLGIKLTENGLINLHKRVNIETMTLLKNFQSMAHIENTTEALKKCIELCAIKLPEPFSNLNAAKMLVGVKESDMESIERQVSDIVLIDDRVSCSLNCLLTMSDPMYYAYNAGRIRLFQVLMRDDYLSQTPLEAAYSWSICCTSAVVGQLEFLNKSFKIKCENLLPGRLFPQDDSSTYNTKLLKPGIIYIVEERNGHPTHPLADIFFCTELGELVLVDVTGGNDKKVKQKKDRLHRWITREQNKVTDYVLHGVVLAPLATGASMTHGCNNGLTKEPLIPAMFLKRPVHLSLTCILSRNEMLGGCTTALAHKYVVS